MNHYCLKSSSTLGPQSAQCSHSVVIVLPSAILHLTRCWALADHDDRLHEITARRLLKYPIQLSKLPFVPTKCLGSPPFYHCASTASRSKSPFIILVLMTSVTEQDIKAAFRKVIFMVYYWWKNHIFLWFLCWQTRFSCAWLFTLVVHYMLHTYLTRS